MRFSAGMKKAILSMLPLMLGFQAAQASVAWYPRPKEMLSFYQRYPDVQRLLWAFDYGHGLLSERMLNFYPEIKSDPAAIGRAVELIETKTFNEVVSILKNPPESKPEEEAISPLFARSFPWLMQIFEWNHKLHDLVYD